MSSGIQLVLSFILGICFLTVVPLSVILIKDIRELISEIDKEDEYEEPVYEDMSSDM